MFTIQTIDNISAKGLSHFPNDSYVITNQTPHPDAILVRSSSLHELTIPPHLK
jgi:D-3-phosphoglycerate dehydrogenase / 2-oxoglutarate reductase